MGISKRTEKQEREHYEREEKKQALMQYIKSAADEKRAQDAVLEFMVSRSAVKGIAYDRKPTGSGGGQQADASDYLIEQRALEEAVETARARTNRVRALISSWIGETGESKAGLITLRYIRGMDIGFIAMLYTWSRRHTERMLDRAIDNLPSIPPELLDMSQEKD